MKISVIGNAASGKTYLSRQLSRHYQIIPTHVDSLQFDASLNMRPHQETRKALRAVLAEESWLIDGYGPLDDFQERLKNSDLIIFLDWPLWRNYWWGTKRLISLLWKKRPELPSGHNELRWGHIRKFYQGLDKVHRLMRPELLRILSRPEIEPRCRVIRTRAQYRKLLLDLPEPIKASGKQI